MANLVQEKKYILSEHKKNSNKLWYIFVYDDHSVKTEYGRVGYNMQSTNKDFTSEYAAQKFFDKKCAEKEKKGYTPLKTLEGQNSGNQVSITNDLSSIVTEEIETDSKATKDLLRYLAEVNIHNIVSNTTITYNKQSGLFETPAGIVNQEAIDAARIILKDIGAFVAKSDFLSDQYGDLLNNYLRIIPQNIGMKFNPEKIYTNLDDVRKQTDILDSLQASLNTVIASGLPQQDSQSQIKRDRLFSVKLHRNDEGKTFDFVNNKYNETRQRMHTSYNLKVKTIYDVEIEHMKKAYDQDGAKMTNRWPLWHGTRSSNLLSILKNGFMIPPKSSSHCTGRMFSDGVYFSDQSTKSLNYAQGYWSRGGSYDNNCFMFICDVAMGNYQVPTGPTSRPPSKGYDSYYAKANQSGVRNNEMIVFRVSQINPRYLIEFSDK
jgi:poly [ADP-ribose] polymerase